MIDEAGAAQRILPPSKRKKTITKAEVEDIVAKIARIPPANVSNDDRSKLKTLERDLKNVVFGQDKALDMLASAVKMARSGLGKGDKPIGSFLFSGPTGVGKTEAATQLADLMGIDLIRLDMSEYAEKHSTARMIGSPPGYVGHEEGGALTEAVRRKPHAVVLFDEVEKAHPDVFDVLLQLLDDGRLTDGQGRTVDFSQTLVLMTSNLRHEDQVRQYFRPEFINRLDEVLVFEALKPEQLNAIAQVQVQRIRAHLAEQEIGLEVSEAALTELAKLGWSEEYGARPLKRAIQKHVQNVLADAILAGRIQRGHTAVVDVSDGRFWVAPKKAEVTATAAV